MEVTLTPEQEAELAKLAMRDGISAEQLVKDVALRLLDADARFRAGIQEGFNAIDRGEYLEEEEMHARVSRMLQL
ncbi:MAG: hypothetical protein JO061_20455 [Acidobacteriaceae bacterium]|nr:hypothetical protein [Acidobacteriaceae bacterium]